MRKSKELLIGALLVAALLLVACDPVVQTDPVLPPGRPVPTDTAVPPTMTPLQVRYLLQQALDNMAQLQGYHFDLAIGTSAGDPPSSAASVNNVMVVVGSDQNHATISISAAPMTTGTVDFIGSDQSHATISMGTQSVEDLLLGSKLYSKRDAEWILVPPDDLNPQLARVYGVPIGVSGPEFMHDFQTLFSAGNVRDVGATEMIGVVSTKHVMFIIGRASTQQATEFWIDPATTHILKVRRSTAMSAVGQQVNTIFSQRSTAGQQVNAIFSQMAEALDLNGPTPGSTMTYSAPEWFSVDYTFSRFNDPAITIPTP